MHFSTRDLWICLLFGVMSKLLKILEATTRNDLPQFSVLCRGIVNREREGPRRRGRARIVMFPSLKLCSSECAPRAPTGSSRLSDAHRGLPCAGLAPLDATRPAAPGPLPFTAHALFLCQRADSHHVHQPRAGDLSSVPPAR